MAANGVFAGTLEYDFIGGGNLIIAANTYVLIDFSLDSQFEAIDVPQPEGTLSSSIEYSFSSIGNVAVSGTSSNEISILLDSSGGVSISGTATGVLPGPTLSSTGGYKPIEGIASLTFEFSSDSFVIYTPARLGAANVNIQFVASGEGYLPISGSSVYPYAFELSSKATQFSLGTASVSYEFDINSLGLNISTHTYDLLGKNGVNFISGIDHNDVTVLQEKNDVKVLNGAKTYVELV